MSTGEHSLVIDEEAGIVPTGNQSKAPLLAITSALPGKLTLDSVRWKNVFTDAAWDAITREMRPDRSAAHHATRPWDTTRTPKVSTRSGHGAGSLQGVGGRFPRVCRAGNHMGFHA